jgi:translation elongation factor EF-1alpha
MKIKIAVLLLLAVVPGLGCAKPIVFEMTVEEIYELNGMVLKGVYLGGTVKKGCIANTDEYVVKRDGKVVIETIGRIFEVVGKTDPEAAVKGEYVKLYIPDVKAQDYKIGDVVSSSKTSCK